MSWYTEDEEESEIPPDDSYSVSMMNEVDENLFIGCIEAEKNLNLLKKKNISHIVQVCKSPRQHYPNNFKYKSISVSDCESFNLKEIFSETNEFIQEGLTEGTGVLIHCVAGVSRSSSVCIAYLMKTKSWTFEKTVQHIKTSREIIMPNKGFVQQLKDYQNEISLEFVKQH
eukprot:gene1187-10701_t